MKERCCWAIYVEYINILQKTGFEEPLALPFPMASSTNNLPVETHFRAPVKPASFCEGLH